jgi:hypothetical protein
MDAPHTDPLRIPTFTFLQRAAGCWRGHFHGAGACAGIATSLPGTAYSVLDDEAEAVPRGAEGVYPHLVELVAPLAPSRAVSRVWFASTRGTLTRALAGGGYQMRANLEITQSVADGG